MNFGSISEISINNSSNYMRAWNIYHHVKFDSVSQPKSGEKDGRKWRSWEFKFTGPDGIYTENIFEPTNNDRKTGTNDNGHDYELPSAQEQLLFFVKQLVETFAPEKLEKFNAYCAKLDAEKDVHKQYELFFDGVRKTLEGSTVETDLLLQGRQYQGRTYAKLPNFVGINRTTHEAFTSERFVGENLMFSAYELKKQAEFEATLKAKPTPMPTEVKPTAVGGSEDISELADLL